LLRRENLSRGIEAVIDAITSESPHVLFGFHSRSECALAFKRKIMPIGERYISFPCPTITITISPNDGFKWLLTMRIGNLIT
jgi:hypothetical protein